MHYYNTFEEALEAKGFEERGNQRNVFEAFREGKHVILKAPTGWGKTFAVTSALQKGHAIYSLPLRVLVNSLAEDVGQVKLGQKPYPKNIAVQHGGRKEHAFLDKGDDPDNPIDIVFTTLDQSLSAFLGIPIGVRYNQGNILPAVIDASHLIFDEFHLMDPQRSMSTALYAINQSRQNCIILTATLSSTMLSFLENELLRTEIGQKNGVAVIIGDRPFVNIKTIYKGPGIENWEELQFGDKTIIICNTKQRAKDIAANIRDNKPELEVYLLHSELLPEDRDTTEAMVKEVFGKGSRDHKKKQILISTQVIEAGIDITCDVMHTDICPPSSFIQRIGRSARYEGESATIYWHDIEKITVYKSARIDIAKLKAILEENDGAILSEELENEIIEIPQETDQKFVKYFQSRNPKQETLEMRTLRDYEQYKDRIRNINSLKVAIGTDPNLNYKYLSISRNTFYGNRFDFPVNFFRYNSETKSYNNVGHHQTAEIALLSPESIGYEKKFGLKEGFHSGEELFIDQSIQTRNEYIYSLEPYEAHIQLLYQEKMKSQWIIEELVKHGDLGKGSVQARELVDGLTDFVIWAHDLGKLNMEWQRAHKVPDTGVPLEEGPISFFKNELELDLLERDYPIAHSDTNGYYSREGIPPSHAWMSAWAVKDMLYEMVQGSEKIFYPVLWAIAEHHGYLRNFTSDLRIRRFQSYDFGYLGYLDEMSEKSPWNKYGWNSSHLVTSIKYEEAMKAHLWFEHHPLLPHHSVDLYYALSYILRKSDQLATSNVSKIKTIPIEAKNTPNNFL